MNLDEINRLTMEAPENTAIVLRHEDWWQVRDEIQKRCGMADDSLRSRSMRVNGVEILMLHGDGIRIERNGRCLCGNAWEVACQAPCLPAELYCRDCGRLVWSAVLRP